jgi:hypothetical protein
LTDFAGVLRKNAGALVRVKILKKLGEVNPVGLKSRPPTISTRGIADKCPI